jgi:hypothetical protein
MEILTASCAHVDVRRAAAVATGDREMGGVP